jgi:hypothetical protein
MLLSILNRLRLINRLLYRVMSQVMHYGGKSQNENILTTKYFIEHYSCLVKKCDLHCSQLK